MREERLEGLTTGPHPLQHVEPCMLSCYYVRRGSVLTECARGVSEQYFTGSLLKYILPF